MTGSRPHLRIRGQRTLKICGVCSAGSRTSATVFAWQAKIAWLSSSCGPKQVLWRVQRLGATVNFKASGLFWLPKPPKHYRDLVALERDIGLEEGSGTSHASHSLVHYATSFGYFSPKWVAPSKRSSLYHGDTMSLRGFTSADRHHDHKRGRSSTPIFSFKCRLTDGAWASRQSNCSWHAACGS